MKNKKATYSSIVAVIAVAVVIFITLSVSKNIGDKRNEKTPEEFIEEDGGIPTVDTFDKLYELLKIADKPVEEKATEELNSDNQEVEEEQIDDETVETTETIEEEQKKEFELASNNYNYYCLNNILYICYGEKVMSTIDFSSTDTEVNTIKNVLLDENRITIIYTKNYMEQETQRNLYTITEMYNIKNKRRPRFEREVKIEGDYYNFKRIDNQIYIFTKKAIDLSNYYGKSIDEINSEDFKIQYSDSAFSEEDMYVDFTKLYYFEETDYTECLNVIGINLNNEVDITAESYIGAGDEITIINTGVYITKTIYDYKDPAIYGYYNNLNITSYIYKFEFENATLNYTNYIDVNGDIINDITQTNGYLIIITENYTTWESENKTYNIYLLDLNLNKTTEKNNVVPEQIVDNIKINDNKIIIYFKNTEQKEFTIDFTQNEKPQII